MINSTSPRRFVALDRDGTVIRLKPYLARAQDVELLPGTVVALHRMRGLGLGLVMVTNQSVVGRGTITLTELGEIHGRVEALLGAEGVQLDGIYACPHAPDDGCDCRKPKPSLLLEASRALHFNLKDCFVVGDNESDILLGRAVGATTILVRTGYGKEIEAAGQVKPDFVAEDLMQACDEIERLVNAQEMKAARS